jgi:hypothetical protein
VSFSLEHANSTMSPICTALQAPLRPLSDNGVVVTILVALLCHFL